MLLIATCLLATHPALSQTPYYAGKTITIIRGGGPGGSGEFQSRALMPYLKKYIPGNPTIMMEFMDGASGRKAANYLYTAKPDGLKIGSAGAMIPGPILGLPGSNYDIDKFIYLGSTETGNPYVLFTRKATGIDSIEKLRTTSGMRVGPWRRLSKISAFTRTQETHGSGADAAHRGRSREGGKGPAARCRSDRAL